MSEWIKITESLPKLETETCSVGVNFLDENGAVYQGYATIENEFVYWYSYEHRSWINAVTHWMPLPEPSTSPARTCKTCEHNKQNSCSHLYCEHGEDWTPKKETR